MTQNILNSLITIDLNYDLYEDRLIFTFNIKNNTLSFLLTRQMTIELILNLSERIVNTNLPKVNISGLDKIKRNLKIEHQLSLEDGGPTLKTSNILKKNELFLVNKIILTMKEYGSILKFESESKSIKINLTRKESHLFIEMLAIQIKKTSWLKIPILPDWLNK